MCCRYCIDESGDFRSILAEMDRSPLMERWRASGRIAARGEIRPADVVPVIASNKAGQRAVFPMKWGFSGRTLLFNARAETAAARPTFQKAWEGHRCIVPASWYYEWAHRIGQNGKTLTGDKYRIRPRDSAMTWLCGLYRIEEGLPVFAVLTREPGETIRDIHDRMPLIMPEALVGEWIKPSARPAELLPFALTDMTAERVI